MRVLKYVINRGQKIKLTKFKFRRRILDRNTGLFKNT